MKKWAICLAWIMVITMVLTGCGEETPSATDPTEPTASAATTASAAKKGAKTTAAGEGDGTTTAAGGDNGDVTTAGGGGNGQTTAAAGKGQRVTTTTANSKYKKHAFGDVTVKSVAHKAYTVAAKGSKYAKGIKLPKLSKSQAKVTYMTNTTWDYMTTESSETAPTAMYHGFLIWKATYGVDVQIELVDWDNFTSYLITSVVAGEAPDTFRYVAGIPKWVNNNLITSLEDKVDLTEKGYALDYMKQSYSMYGHIYAGFSTGMRMPTNFIMFNKTKFENAGVKDPLYWYNQGKWTFTQFIKTAKQMTDAANDEYGLAGTGYFYPQAFTMMYLNDDATVTLRIKDSQFVKCMQAVWKLYHVEKAARRTDDCRATFPKGQDAMAPSGGKEFCRMMDTAKAAGTTDKFDIVPMPSYDMVGFKKPIGGNQSYQDGFCISSCPKNMEGAVELFRLFIMTGANIANMMGDWGWCKNYFTAAQKERFKKVQYQNKEGQNAFGHGDCTGAIDGTNTPDNETLKYPIYLTDNENGNLSTILANAYSAFTGVIKEYEINAGLRS